jgi:hypothetical protein
LEKTSKQPALADPAQINQDRGVSNDNHLGNRAFKLRRSSASISSV